MTGVFQQARSFAKCGTIFRINKKQYLIGWGRQTWVPACSNSARPAFFFPDFFLTDQNPWCYHEFTAILEGQEILEFLAPYAEEQEKITWSNPYRPVFESSFKEVQQLFYQGLLKKAVLYVFDKFFYPLSSSHKLSALTHLIKNTHAESLHVYGFWNEKEGMLGATPELLFDYALDNHEVRTVACAGTYKNGEKNLLKSPKNLYEHQLVIQGITESLEELGLLSMGETEVVQFPTLSHLITPIVVQLGRAIDFMTLTHLLHPTPALGAFPKNPGWKWLRQYQNLIPRGRFGAPVGYVLPSHAQAKCYVGIRNIRWNTEETSMGAGCGIVAESQLEMEWEEILLKLRSIKEMMAL